jgi:type I restriction enzyme R subunit
VNEAEDIYKAFKPYYDATSLQEGSDPQQLEKLKHELDAAQVYFWSEVEAFARIFYKPVSRQIAQDHAGMQLHLQPAVDRFKAMEDESKRSEFHERLKGYVNIYSFLSQIMPYGDPVLEMLYSYGRFLLPHLPLDRDTERVKIADEVELQYYRLERIYSGEITLKTGEPEGVKSPTDVGTGKAKDQKVPLSEVIKVLNGRFGTNFTDEDRFFFEQIREKATANEQVVKLRRANAFDKFQLGLRHSSKTSWSNAWSTTTRFRPATWTTRSSATPHSQSCQKRSTIQFLQVNHLANNDFRWSATLGYPGY